MKIEDLQGVSQAGVQKPNTGKIEAGRSFEAILNEQVPAQQSGESGGAAPKRSEGPSPPAAPIYISTESDLSPSEIAANVAIQKIEVTLNLLEQYHDELLDPTKTLKALADTVELLKQEVGGLQGLLAKHPIEEDLKEIINQTAIQTQVEVTRFDQGILL